MALLIAAFALIFIVVGMAMTSTDRLGGPLVIVLSLIVLLFVYVADKRRKAAKELAEAEADRNRISELTAAMTAPDFKLRIEGSSGLGTALAASAVTLMLAYMAWMTHSLAFLAVAIVAGAFSLLTLMIAWSVFGRSILTLDHKGARSPLSRLIPWDAIDGIHLEVVSHRGVTLLHMLVFRVPALPEMIGRFPLAARIQFRIRFGAQRGNFGVPLKKTSESPEVIREIARRLWTLHTGHEHEWSPHFSEEFNRAMRDLRESRLALERSSRDGIKHGLPLQGELDRMTRSGEIVSEEIKSRLGVMRWLSWTGWLLVLGVVALLLAHAVVR